LGKAANFENGANNPLGFTATALRAPAQEKARTPISVKRNMRGDSNKV